MTLSFPIQSNVGMGRSPLSMISFPLLYHTRTRKAMFFWLEYLLILRRRTIGRLIFQFIQTFFHLMIFQHIREIRIQHRLMQVTLFFSNFRNQHTAIVAADLNQIICLLFLGFQIRRIYTISLSIFFDIQICFNFIVFIIG